MTTLKKEKIPELQLVRALCIIAVVTVHATSYATLQMTGSRYFVIYNFLNIFMKYGTPTFIAISAFVLFYNYNERPVNKALLTSFYKKRFLYILLPYFMFSLFYFALTQLAVGSPFNGELIRNFFVKLFTGKAYTHLYFVFINMQFYLLFPFLLLLFKRYPQIRKYSIVAGILIQWGFILANKYHFQVANRGSWCLTYFSYYMLGAWLGMYYPQIKTWIEAHRSEQTKKNNPPGMVFRGIWAIWLTSGISHTMLYYQNRRYGTSFNSLIYELLYSTFAFTSLLVLMSVARFLLRKSSLSFLYQPLERLGSFSFGVYLIHPLFLLLYRQLSPTISTSWLLHLWYVGGFIIAQGFSWIAVSLSARYLPFAWVLFGNVSQNKKEGSHTTSHRSSPAFK
ncbi:acyltransferase [Paenibacillus odorifer]|uniref:Acyltransferase n=1 Tax=Paenibacillus odorifer TaxID=189426 RepID=A0A1R0XXP9_9BACL|nr:acyltransferase [Paenibacillus odorifer]OMD39868.1 acyltransferase [Paenibacillus odorifer]